LRASNLILRIASAVVILPPALAAIWLGGWYFAGLIVLIAGAVGWEWSALCGARAGVREIAIATTVISALVAFVSPPAAYACIAFGALSAWVVARLGNGEARILPATGIAYLSVAILSMVWLRLAPDTGRFMVLWIVALVVATDVGAYFTGRAIGGPRLAPRISPGKTWAGLFGGMVCAGLAGFVLAHVLESNSPGLAAALSGGLAVVAQAGDLVESAVKRHFGVKDSGMLIPGHGGVLDRLDGFLTVAPAVALMAWSAGESPLKWQ
jgi:phosphatidate cytidylyltransferase